MKRIIAFVICVLMLLTCFVPAAYASGVIETVDNVVSFTCDYDEKNSQVVVEGTVGYDFMVRHSDHRISVYSILPGDDVETSLSSYEAKELAGASMTVKFTFYVKISSNIERYSKYAIIFTSPEGELLLAGEPKIPSVTTVDSYTSASKESFKGIMSESSAIMSDSGAGTVIIDVDLGKLLGDSSDSLLYPMNDSYIHIRRSYIAEIDRKMLSAAVFNSRVYFRFLLCASDTAFAAVRSEYSDKYTLPDLYSESVMDHISTMAEFLAKRYCDGQIDGIIVGSRIDDVENVNAIGDMTVDEYAELYTLYLTVLGNAVNRDGGAVDVVIPLSDANDYTDGTYSDNTFRASALLENIIYRLNYNLSGDFYTSMMVESYTTPLGITNTSIGNGIDTGTDGDASKIGVSNISELASYLASLDTRYNCIPSNIIYLWHSDADLGGDALCCAYAYMYKTLAQNDLVSSFIADFGDRYDNVKKLFKYIDTDRADEALSAVVNYFDDISWMSNQTPTVRKLIEKGLFQSKPEGILGEFVYMDFTSSWVFDCMNGGENCQYIRSDYDSEGTRAMCLGSSAMSVGDTVECIGIFDYSEDYRYTPYVSLKLEVSDETASERALYEISLTIGCADTRVTAMGIVRNGEQAELFFDISEYAELSSAEYIKISVRCLNEDTEGMSVWLHDLKGYSTEYSSERLSELIEALRLAEKGDNGSGEDGFDYTVILTVIGIVIALVAVGIGLLMLLRRTDEHDKNKGQ